MLYTFPRLKAHSSFRLNRNLLYFFSKLRKVSRVSTFAPLTDYFDKDFATFLSKKNQATLKGLFAAFFNKYKALKKNDKDTVVAIFRASQNINGILSNVGTNGNAIKLTALPIAIRPAAKNLLSYLYSTTMASYGKIHDHYQNIFDQLTTNICPFCGIEFLNDPSILRQDYDHMLMISHYIFCGVNMDNLVPTGVECNRVNKHNIDVLYDGGNRRVFNSPYRHSFNIRVSLAGSTPPAIPGGTGNWNITFQPNNDYIASWASVYNIRDRYANNVLKKFYLAWLKELRDYLYISNRLPISQRDLENELIARGLTMQDNPTTSSANIVKGALYDFIANHLDPLYKTAIVNFINAKAP